MMASFWSLVVTSVCSAYGELGISNIFTPTLSVTLEYVQLLCRMTKSTYAQLL